jgi:NAD-dependent dihydropyrimidine dehydrogenase PreA subunit
MTDIQGPDNGPGKKTELVIIEPATATILAFCINACPVGVSKLILKNTHRKSNFGEAQLCRIAPP